MPIISPITATDILAHDSWVNAPIGQLLQMAVQSNPTIVLRTAVPGQNGHPFPAFVVLEGAHRGLVEMADPANSGPALDISGLAIIKIADPIPIISQQAVCGRVYEVDLGNRKDIAIWSTTRTNISFYVSLKNNLGTTYDGAQHFIDVGNVSVHPSI